MQQHVRVNTLSDEYIYYNFNLANREVISNSPLVLQQQAINAQFTENRNQPILDNPSNYKLAIARMDITSVGIPKSQFVTYKYLTLVFPFGTIEDQQNLALVQVEFDPNYSSTSIFYFQQLCDSFNTAATSALAALRTAYGSGTWDADADIPKIAPRLVFNSESNLFSLIVDSRMRDDNAKRVEIWMNYPLYRLLESIYANKYSYNDPSNKDCKIRIDDRIFNRIAYPPASATTLGYPLSIPQYYLEIKQENNSLSLHYDTYKLVLVSNTLGIRREFISVQNIDNSGEGTEIRTPICTDYTYDLSDSNLFSRITYVPLGGLRYVDMQSNTALDKIDFQLFRETTSGELIRMQLPPGTSWNLKAVFVKKF